MPIDATSVEVNVTVTNATDVGYVTLFAANTTLPLVSTLNFRPGESLANGATIPLAPIPWIPITPTPPPGDPQKTRDPNAKDLKVNVFVAGNGTTHVILDVFGYYY